MFFMIDFFEERGKVSTTVSEVEKVMSLEIVPLHELASCHYQNRLMTLPLSHLPWTSEEIKACCFYSVYLF